MEFLNAVFNMLVNVFYEKLYRIGTTYWKPHFKLDNQFLQKL